MNNENVFSQSRFFVYSIFAYTIQKSLTNKSSINSFFRLIFYIWLLDVSTQIILRFVFLDLFFTKEIYDNLFILNIFGALSAVILLKNNLLNIYEKFIARLYLLISAALLFIVGYRSAILATSIFLLYPLKDFKISKPSSYLTIFLLFYFFYSLSIYRYLMMFSLLAAPLLLDLPAG
ncbi:hypothetical protein [Polynucleobacter sp. CS-Odin-A6]|uniref:hypothetical protein n=1 Tax=Polynucleobacter sp. CS-Odin-A6 TaxID=2689106 RepID=UPI001C0E6A06|nr:hypothetical protein [Polynucleobacter sp. CS-Odin-A6]MBU3621112.1 hypothetical protein [Polynucleobacter sp. CS-Odin-A6]